MMLSLAMISFVLSASLIAADINAVEIVSYDELKQLNVSCPPKDTCAERKPDVYPGIDSSFTCSCHEECSLLGTCCIDSPHRDESSSAKLECSGVDFPQTIFKSSGYYMVQRCPENSAWKHLCEEDLYKDGDVMKFAPVSSLDTNTTYRNYYCFRCNEKQDNFLFWHLNLLGAAPIPETDDLKVTYDVANNTWSATADDEDISVVVKLNFVVPHDLQFPMIPCNSKVVSKCPDSWEDDIVRRKCESYTALQYKSFGPPYKNVHCALCNYQSLSDLSCNKAAGFAFVQRVFSFAHLIDVNMSDGDVVGKKAKCAEGEMWDPYAKKCRKLSCALPGYVIKEGKCVAP